MALFTGLAAAAFAAGQAPPVATVVLLAPAQLTPYPSGSPQTAPAYEAWSYVGRDPSGYLAARLGPQGRPVPGRWLARRDERAWPELWLFAPQGLPGLWWVPLEASLDSRPPREGGEGRVGLLALVQIPENDAALVPGPPQMHAKRLARLRLANLSPQLKRRLAAGCLEKGDNLWWAELAWGKPQRSFMVNYISDEQHFVYLTPGGPVLLRFVGGRLQQAPAQPLPMGPDVANPSTHR